MSDSLHIELKLEGAAFADGGAAYEAARMLRVAAERISGSPRRPTSTVSASARG